jgi:hypothetical protein
MIRARVFPICTIAPATAAMTDDTIPLFSLPALLGKKVPAAFDGGRMSSDGGVMLLSLAERRLGACGRLPDTGRDLLLAADLVAVGERAGAERRDAPDLRTRRSMETAPPNALVVWGGEDQFNELRYWTAFKVGKVKSAQCYSAYLSENVSIVFNKRTLDNRCLLRQKL